MANAIAVALLSLWKVLDRTPSILRNDFAMAIPQSADQVLIALEEGTEMLVQALLIFALMLFEPTYQPRVRDHSADPAFLDNRLLAIRGCWVDLF